MRRPPRHCATLPSSPPGTGRSLKEGHHEAYRAVARRGAGAGVRSRLARRAAAAGGSRLRGGAFGLERRDRPAARPDRPVRGSRRCDRGGRLRARQRPAGLRARGWPQRGGLRGVRRWADDRPVRDEGDPGRPGEPHGAGRTRRHRGASSTARPRPSAWRPPAASCPRRASPGSPWAAASAT